MICINIARRIGPGYGGDFFEAGYTARASALSNGSRRRASRAPTTPYRRGRNSRESVRRVNISLVAFPHFAESAPLGIDSPQFLQRRAMRVSFITSPYFTTEQPALPLIPGGHDVLRIIAM